MSISAEHIQAASVIFFQLLKRRMIPNHDHVLAPLFDVDEVRDALKMMTDEAGVQLLQGPDHVHFVSRPEGSIFATSFTHMRKRYADIESKKYFHLMNVILLVFLAEVDVEASRRLRWETNGVSYYQLENQINIVMSRWKQEQTASSGTFSQAWGLAVDVMAELWETMAIDDESDRDSRLMGNRRTHIGLIHMAVRLLKDENLVYLVEDEKRIIPRSELYERLEAVYHHQDRYQRMKQMIDEAFVSDQKTEGI